VKRKKQQVGYTPKFYIIGVSMHAPSILIFINDLVEIGEENIKLYLFADDAKIYCHVKNLTDK